MTSTTSVAERPQTSPQPMPPAMSLVMVWQVVLGLGSFYAITLIAQLEEGFNLAGVVKLFLMAVVAVAGLASLGSAVLLLRGSNVGRIVAMFINLTGAILAGLVLGHLLGLFVGIDDLANALHGHAAWLIGLAIGYAIIWGGRRFFDETSQAGFYIERIGLGVMLLSIMVLLLVAGLPGAVGVIIGRWLQPGALLVTVGLVVCAAAAIYLLRQSERFGETMLQREAWQGWLFLLPNFISFMIFFALPLLLSFYLSFTDYGETSLSRANWVGARNYSQTLSVQFVTVSGDQSVNDLLYPNYGEVMRVSLGDSALVMGARVPLFWNSLGNTIRYCVYLLILAIIPALGLALILNSKVPGMKVFRALFFLPSIAAVVGVALIWQWLYNPVVGFINYTIRNVATFFGAADPNIQWLTDDAVLLIAVVIMAAWQVIGFNTVIFLAGLQGINREVMEAATVDGAGAWTRFRRIMLPLLAPTTFFITVTTLIAGLQAFSEFFVLLANSTSNARLTTVYYLYLQGFRDIRFGYASSTAWVLFVLIFVVTLIQFRLSSRAEAYSD